MVAARDAAVRRECPSDAWVAARLAEAGANAARRAAEWVNPTARPHDE